MSAEEEAFEFKVEPNLNLPPQEFLAVFEAFDPNIDGDILERAWRTFDATQQQVLLEGEQRAWMVCAFYTSVWQATPLGSDPPYVYSLTQLLKQCNLSVLEFFDKLNKWVEMISGPRRLQEHISRVQATLAVSTVIYKKYLPIVRALFRIHTDESNDPDELTTAKLFEYIWLIYLTLKKLLPSGLEDLLNSFHILLCVIVHIVDELAYMQSPILNPDFVKLQQESGTRNELEFLCQQFDGVELDARHLLQHWVEPKLQEFHAKLAQIDETSEGSLLANWSYNLEEFNAQYEQQMLRRAEIDERMFVKHVVEDVDTAFNQQFDDSAITILKRGNLESSWAVDADLLLRVSTQRCMEKVQLTVKPLNTPLTARSYVISSEQFCPATPISAASQRAHKLHELFVVNTDEDAQADSEFDRLLAQCRENPRLFIGKRVDAFEQLIERRVEEERATRGAAYDAAISCQLRQRLGNVELLFQRLLQKTVMYDRSRNSRANIGDLNAILHKADFVTGLYVCALEIVLMTYNSEREFPWSVDTLQMPPINFYKAIEIVVRAEPDLSRDMVKHLNRCEERVLEELAWTVDSPLWSALSRRPNSVPACTAVTPDSVMAPNAVGGSGRVNTLLPATIHVRYPPSPIKPLERMTTKRPGEAPEDELPSKKPSGESGATAISACTALFFRKVYFLAAVRLNDLCDRLRIEELARSRVWTILEHLLRSETKLMLGRHLDQNLMCCIYITAKISGLDLSFNRIMSDYRHQPQFATRIYRQVLVPAECNSDSNSNSEPSEYTDLIKYYNRIFVPRVEDFVKKLHPPNSDSKENIVPILPMPRMMSTTLSPRRMVGSQLCVMPMSAVTHAPRRVVATSSGLAAGVAAQQQSGTIKTETTNVTVGPATVIRRRVF